MEVRMETVGDCSVLKLAGRMDGPGARKFRQATAALHGVRSASVVIDLGDASAFLASGAEAILHLAEQYRENGGGVALVKCSPTASRLLQAAGANVFIPILPSLADARAFLQSSKRGP